MSSNSRVGSHNILTVINQVIHDEVSVSEAMDEISGERTLLPVPVLF